MDPELVRVEAIPQDVRRRVFEYVTSVKGVKPSDLGYDKTYMYRVRRGLMPISDNLFRALLKFIDVDEYARLVGSAPPLVEATPDDIIRVVKKALVDKSFRNLLFDMLRQAFGDEFREYRASWTVTEHDVEEFVRAKRLRGLKEKTIRDHVHYLRLALSDLNWTLEPEGARELLAGLREEGEEHVLRHVTVALKSFLKNVLKPRDPALFRLMTHSRYISLRATAASSCPAQSSSRPFGGDCQALKAGSTSPCWLRPALGPASPSPQAFIGFSGWIHGTAPGLALRGFAQSWLLHSS